jgi:NADPH2:quinone reductase
VRAVRLHEIGGTPRVDEIDDPDGPALLDVSVAGLNPVDVSTAAGRFYGGSPPTPYVIGQEAVGVTPEGRRVWQYGRGAMAERVALADPGSAVDVPDGVSDELAVACGVAGLTGWTAISWRTRITPDDTVLVLGASGTVGSTALQGAKVLGAGRVIGAARHPERIPGQADEVVRIDGSESYPEATVIVDGLWGEPLERALAAAARGVRVVHLGQSAGGAATLQSAWVRGKVASVLGHSLFAVPLEERAAGFRELALHAAAGRIAYEVESFGLDRFDEAWARQSAGSPGAKIVVRLA